MAVDISELVADLAKAFPRQAVSGDSVRVYRRALEDIPPAVLQETVDELIRTSRFFPTVAEIREAAAERTLGLPSEAEALEQIKARQRWARDPEILDPADPPTLHPLVREAVDHVGGWHAFRASDRAEVVRGQFLRLYRDLRAAGVRDYQVGRELAPGPTRPELTP